MTFVKIGGRSRPSISDAAILMWNWRALSYLSSSRKSYSSAMIRIRFDKIKETLLTAEFGTMLIGIFRGFLVRRSSDVEKTVDTGLDGIDTLVPQLKRLPRIRRIFVDDTVDELLNRHDILRGAEFTNIVQHARSSASKRFKDRVYRGHEMLEHDNLVDGLFSCLQGGLAWRYYQLSRSILSVRSTSTMLTAVRILSASRKFFNAIAGQNSRYFVCGRTHLRELQRTSLL
jgi:hypothetical protein